MTVKIVLRKDKINNHGLCPAVIQISSKKKVGRLPLGFSLHEKDFNAEGEIVLKSNSEHKNYNELIKSAKQKIADALQIIRDLQSALIIPDVVESFKDLYNCNTEDLETKIASYHDKYGLKTEEIFVRQPNRLGLVAKFEIRIPISLHGTVRQLIRKLVRKERDPLLDEIMNEPSLDENEKEINEFFQAWEKYLKVCKLEQRPNTSSRLENFMTILKEYSKITSIPLMFESFTEDFGMDFKQYLLNEHYNYLTKQKGVSNGTVHNILKSISTFLNWSFKKGLNKSIEFKKWNTQKPKTDLQYLTESQLKALRKFSLTKGGSLDKSRDLWLFSAYSGMRCGDIQSWLPSYVTNEGVIKYKSEKTKKNCAVGLNTVTRSILKKYKGDLPKQNSVKINKNIKEILKQMGFDKINVNRVISKGTQDIVNVMTLAEAITMHSAKRSFINLMISKNTQIAHLSTMIGNDIKSLMVYYKNDSSQIKKVMDGIRFA